jgi:hypothetical protein
MQHTLHKEEIDTHAIQPVSAGGCSTYGEDIHWRSSNGSRRCGPGPGHCFVRLIPDHNSGSFGALREEEKLLKCVFIERVAQPFPWEEITAAPLWEGQETRISDRTKLPTHLSRPR